MGLCDNPNCTRPDCRRYQAVKKSTTINIYNTNSAKSGAESSSCAVALVGILTAASTLVAVCAFFPGVIPVAAGTAVAYTADMLRQQA